MSLIRVLHASDLHIAVPEQRRSYLDACKDAVFALPSLNAKAIWKALRRMSIASSYDARILEHLAEFIVNNSKGVKPGVEQYDKETASKHEIVFLDDKLDAIVLSGDLATTGLEGDLRRVNGFLTAEYDPDAPHRPKDLMRMIGTLFALDLRTTKVACLPGNHDRYWFHWKVPTYMPGDRLFDAAVANYWVEPVQTTSITSKSGDLKVVIIAADFSLRRISDCEGPFGWIAQGRVYNDSDNDVLGQLVSKTRGERANSVNSDQVCILWALHFPPEFPGQSEQHKLIGEEKLLAQADPLGVNGILAGHTHYQLKYREASPNKSPVFCCGTTTQFEPKSSVLETGAKGRRGNLFQILTITNSATGQIHIERDEYYHPPTLTSVPRTQTHWRKIT